MTLKAISLAVVVATAAMAQTGVFVSRPASADFAPTADPNAPQWKDAASVIAPNDPMGNPVEGHRTEIRSFWTKKNLSFLFICPYGELNSKPDPEIKAETNKLWDWDVAEVFIGSDLSNITHYKEFEVSPHGEWVDLDIDRKQPLPKGGIGWDSGFQLKTRIDEEHKIWYGEMQIPFKSISDNPPEADQQFRLNLYRIQGPGPDRVMIAWQPTHKRNFHVPDAFGILRLAK